MAKWKNRTRRQQRVCQICGYSDTSKLEIHHILSRSLNPELKDDERNLISLCHECHEALHEEIQPMMGLEHNECDFNSIIMLYIKRGTKKNWNKRKFMQKILEKAKTGYYNHNKI